MKSVAFACLFAFLMGCGDGNWAVKARSVFSEDCGNEVADAIESCAADGKAAVVRQLSDVMEESNQ